MASSNNLRRVGGDATEVCKAGDEPILRRRLRLAGKAIYWPCGRHCAARNGSTLSGGGLMMRSICAANASNAARFSP